MGQQFTSFSISVSPFILSHSPSLFIISPLSLHLSCVLSLPPFYFFYVHKVLLMRILCKHLGRISFVFYNVSLFFSPASLVKFSLFLFLLLRFSFSFPHSNSSNLLPFVALTFCALCLRLCLSLPFSFPFSLSFFVFFLLSTHSFLFFTSFELKSCTGKNSVCFIYWL